MTYQPATIYDIPRALTKDNESESQAFVLQVRGLSALTQKQFARRLGITELTIIRWENGQTEPGEIWLSRIADLQADLLAMNEEAFRDYVMAVTCE